MPPHVGPRCYYRVLLDFMNFRDGNVYEDGHVFQDEELAPIRPEELLRWMELKAYGIENPGPNDHPTECRLNTIASYKKSISYYLPNRLHAWNAISGVGNPTKSTEVNDLLKRMRKAEVRKLGAPPKACRPLEKAEFDQVVELLNATHRHYEGRFMVPTAIKFQFCMIARLHDTAQFKKEDLKPNPQFGFTVLAQMCWSKNVLEERNAPDQILLGSDNPRYCVLLALGLHLEEWLATPAGVALPYLFGRSNNPKTAARRIYSILRQVFESDDFNSTAIGNLGTHSFRKYATTYARRNGCSKDDADHRGCWAKKRIVDRYIDRNLPYPDAKVASVLAVGGPIKYVLVHDSGVTDQWLCANVVPHIIGCAKVHDGVALVLALPILWAAQEADMEGWMPPRLRTRIRAAYEIIRTLPEGTNPVKKLGLVVSGHESEVNIDEFDFADGNNAQGLGAGGGNNPTLVAEQMRALYAQNQSLRRELMEMKTEMRQRDNQVKADINRVNRNIQRIAIQPVVRPVTHGGGATNGGEAAVVRRQLRYAAPRGRYMYSGKSTCLASMAGSRRKTSPQRSAAR